MNRTMLCTAIIAFCVVMLVGCSNDDTVAPTTGSIYGGIQLWDAYNDVVPDESIVVVTATSTDGKVYADTTAADGKWEIKNLPAQVYVLKANHPEYPISAMLTGVLLNVPCVGAGAYGVQDLGLMAEPKHEFARTLEVLFAWKYTTRQDGHGGPVTIDSSRTLTVKLESKTSKPHDQLEYRFKVAESADASCDAALFGINPQRERAGNLLTFDVTEMYNQLTQGNPSGNSGRTFYLQIRPRYNHRDPYTFAVTDVCTEPYVVPITF